MSDIDDEILKEINATIAALSPTQRQALKDVFNDKEDALVPRATRAIPPKDRVHECTVTITCKLCGYQVTQTFKSSSVLPSQAEVPNCGACFERLMLLEKEAVVRKLIRAIDSTCEIKESRPAVEFKAPEERRINVEE